MSNMYQPPYTITANSVNLVARISEGLGCLASQLDDPKTLRLRRVNRVRTIHGSLAIEGNTKNSDAAPFIEFMLRMIGSTLSQATPHVTPQVELLLGVFDKEMSRSEIQAALGLRDRKSCRVRYLKPALEQGYIEMTIPEKPNSRLQQYRLSTKGRLWLKESD